VTQLFRRPRCGLGNDAVGIVLASIGVGKQCWIAGIADSSEDVANEPVSPDPLDRRGGEHRAKLSVIQG
jgi:hypothetical protein